MSFWRKVSIIGAAKDFAGEWSRENPHRWRVLAVSIAVTGGLLILAIPKDQRIEPRRPEVTYITSFADGRTDEEIIRTNEENQVFQDWLHAKEEERAELRKDLYRTLGRATGVDVDAMERDIEEQRLAEEQAVAQRTAGVTPGAADLGSE